MTNALDVGFHSLLKPSATMRNASTSSPESVSSRMVNLGSSIAIWNISLRFFSPPEKPSFTLRPVSLLSIDTSALFSFIRRRNSLPVIGSSPSCLRLAFTAARMKLTIDTPGISTGCWKERKMPLSDRSSAESESKSSPS